MNYSSIMVDIIYICIYIKYKYNRIYNMLVHLTYITVFQLLLLILYENRYLLYWIYTYII